MKFNIYTLGCKVNTYESNVMLDALENAGYTLVNTTDSADISIINTCTVTNTADNKSLKTIRKAIKQNPKAIIVACGCFIQNKTEDSYNIPGVDIVIGNVNKSKIVDYIEEYISNHKKIEDVKEIMTVPFEPMKLNNFNKTRAFVKIQDGCNNFCAFCIIPYARGDVRSKKREDVIDEIETLVNNGHQEIVLTGIHTGNYGVEFQNYDFADLLADIIKIPGLKRLRISSIEITEINDRVLKLFETSSILVDHMHIPLQSGSVPVLKRMNRKYDIEYFKRKVDLLRSIRPDMSITTDVIVGFPGETTEEFLETVQNIKEIGFTKLHVFPYSKRDGTVAALMPKQIEGSLKKERARELLNLSKELEIKYMERFIGKKLTYLPEIFKNGLLIGHTGNFLLVKQNGLKSQLHTEKSITITKIEYPYCIASIDSLDKIVV